ncbi:MAG TPA: type VI secretion system Vgr family protein [Aromatoleum sp.]|uniref:type VI secretion system Vgr family protein n=1 Tax=Aromatoleum sp. TaxID=2307007 RepID=UPI002B4754B3|nr:type VI secretion system Vgr family protein [Aromatoleum sp.]HJV25911.1 type VI secretion system Vgr family protein [Aromatoleum sp.]
MIDLRDLFDTLLSQHARLLELTTPLPDTALVVERFGGREALSEPFRFEVDCVSTNAHLALNPLLGEEVSLRLLLADGSGRRWHGYVTEAMQLGADGGLARYRLVIEPWLAFLRQRRDCRLYQDVDAVTLTETIFARYPSADWRSEVTQPLRRHSRLTQYRESDLEFLQRVLADEGLSFHFEHDQDVISGDGSGRARHRLVLVDRDATLPPCPQATIRFHRNDATEGSDTIQSLHEIRQPAPNAVTLCGWDYKRVGATASAAASPQDNGELPSLEIYDGSNAYRFEDAAAATLRTDLALSAHESRYRKFEGTGRVRALAAGRTFALTQHDLHSADPGRFASLAVTHHGANNLGAQVAALLDAPDVEAGTYRNAFVAQPADVPVVPLPRVKPVAAPQTALVVGLPEAPLTTDRDHRIKIQFHWQRGLAPNPGGLAAPTSADSRSPDGNAPGNAASGTWVRVAEWLAGPNWGTSFVPRIGTEVLVDFLDADMDRPIVVGQLYNGEQLPPFSAGVDAAANHPGVLSGWMSHNFEAGYNQWVADDTPDQLRTRISTSHGTSELVLGRAIHQSPQSSTRGAARGEGFELRTDGWLAVRAGEGLLISATSRPLATSTQMDAAEAVERLRTAERSAEALSNAAAAQGAGALAANVELRAFADTIDPAHRGKYEGSVGGQAATKAAPASREPGAPTERFADPLLLAESPADIGLNTPASALAFAGGHFHSTAQHDLHATARHTLAAAVGEDASWFSHSGGIKVIAAAGTLSLQAHTDAMEILADDSVTITSSNDEIRISAKERIALKAGQSGVTLEGGDITFACPGTFSVKGSGNAFIGPAKGQTKLGALPDSRARIYTEQFKAVDSMTGQPMPDLPYRVELADGTVLRGITDKKGLTQQIATADPQNLRLYWEHVTTEPCEAGDDSDIECC